MDYLGFLLAVAAVIWIMALVKSKVDLDVRVIPISAFLILIIGSVFGHAFFHKSVITIDRLMLAALCGFYGLSLMKGKEHLKRLRSVDWAVIALTGFLILNTFAYDYKTNGNLPFSRLLFFVLMPVAFYFLIRNAKLRLSDLKLISIAMALFALYLGATGIAEQRGLGWAVFPRYIMDEVRFEEFFGRARGPFVNPVSNGIFMIVGMASALMWWPHVQPRGKMLIGITTAVVSLGVFATLTRSVWLSMILGIGLIVWLVASKQQRITMAIAGSMVAVVLGLAIADDIQKFKRDKNVSEADMKQSASLRPLFAIIAWDMFKDRPILGCGFGQYTDAKEPYMIDPHSGQPLRLTKTFMQHNIYLAFLTESGLVGVGLLTLMLMQFNRIGIRMFLDQKFEPWVRAYGLLLVVFLVVYFVNGMFHDVSIIPQANVLMFCLAGVVANLHYGHCAEERATREAIRQEVSMKGKTRELVAS